MAIKLIVGLGNPGPTYEKTRHNAGFWFLTYLADIHHQSFKSERQFHGLMTPIRLDHHTCQLLHPTSFMNDSGRSIQAVSHFYHYKPEEILVAHDDLDLPVGTCRLKLGGGHGGHNGLRDTIQCLGTQDFYRLRIGIGHPGHKDKVHDYVLSAPSRADKEIIEASIERITHNLSEIIHGDIQKAMTLLHTGEKNGV